MAEDHRAVLRPEVEMADPELGVHNHQKVGHVLAAYAFGDAHVEGAGKMQRLEVLAPGEAEMMVAPAPGDGEVQFVPLRAFEGPAIGLHRALDQVERVQHGLGFIEMGKTHAPILGPQNEAVGNQTGTRFRYGKSPGLVIRGWAKDSTAYGGPRVEPASD